MKLEKIEGGGKAGRYLAPVVRMVPLRYPALMKTSGNFEVVQDEAEEDW